MDGIRYISAKQVSEITSLSQRTIARKVEAGLFPKPVKLGEGARQAFVEAEVYAWNAEQLACARGHPLPAPRRSSSQRSHKREGA